MAQLQITVDEELDRVIRAEAKHERLTVSSYVRRLLVTALRDAGVVIRDNDEMPILRKTEMN